MNTVGLDLNSWDKHLTPLFGTEYGRSRMVQVLTQFGLGEAREDYRMAYTGDAGQDAGGTLLAAGGGNVSQGSSRGATFGTWTTSATMSGGGGSGGGRSRSGSGAGRPPGQGGSHSRMPSVAGSSLFANTMGSTGEYMGTGEFDMATTRERLLRPEIRTRWLGINTVPTQERVPESDREAYFLGSFFMAFWIDNNQLGARVKILRGYVIDPTPGMSAYLRMEASKLLRLASYTREGIPDTADVVVLPANADQEPQPRETQPPAKVTEQYFAQRQYFDFFLPIYKYWLKEYERKKFCPPHQN